MEKKKFVKKQGRVVLFLILLLLFPLGALAQQKMIKGQVVDDSGEAIIGATVMVKGNTGGTITDIDGNFSIQGKVGSILSITYVGYASMQVKVTKLEGNKYVMKEDAKVLDEVVVVGMDTQKRNTITAAVATLKDDAIVNRPVTDVTSALQGNIAGLNFATDAVGGGVGGETGADKVLGGTLRLFVQKVYEGSYFSRNEEVVLHANANLPNGNTLEQMNTLMKRMETYLSEFKEIKQFQTSVESARRSSIHIYFSKEHQKSGFPYTLKANMISKALQLGGGNWSIYGLQDQGFSNDVRENAGSFRVKMYGYNYDALYDWVEKLKAKLLSHRRIREVTIGSDFSWWKDDYFEVRYEDQNYNKK